MNIPSKDLILEKDGLRGLVPSRKYGIRDTVYGAYLQRLNPRENEDFQLALAASKDPRFQDFLEKIKSARFRRMAVQTIAKGCGISLMEFQNWWQKATTQQAIADAQMAGLTIIRDMVGDARTREAVCERCDGMTWIAAPQGLPLETPGYRSMTCGDEVRWIRDCPACRGGKVSRPGDSHARDRVLEVGGLIQKNKSLVQINQNFGGAEHASAVSQLDSMTMDLPDSDFEVTETLKSDGP